MKLLSATLMLIAILGLLVYSNPTMDDYSNYVRQQMIEEAKNQEQQFQGFNVALGGIAGFFIPSATTRKNYIFFSVYRTEFGSKRMKCTGALGNFFGCKDLAATGQNGGS